MICGVPSALISVLRPEGRMSAGELRLEATGDEERGHRDVGDSEASPCNAILNSSPVTAAAMGLTIGMDAQPPFSSRFGACLEDTVLDGYRSFVPGMVGRYLLLGSQDQ